MDIKSKITSFFLSKINVSAFSDLIKKSVALSLPYKIFSQILIDKNFPHHIFLETTNVCNLKCKMCPRNVLPFKIGSMDFILFKKILDESAKHGKRTFSLHLFGEPLLDNLIFKKIKYIKTVNEKNTILLTTNGVLLTPAASEQLIKNGVDKVIISIHSPNRETYKEITGVDQLELVEKNIRELARLKAESQKPQIYLRMIKMTDNASEEEDFRKKWKGVPVKIEIRHEHNYGGDIENNFPEKRTEQRYPCYHLWLSPGINWDGEMSICCADPNRLAIVGNINNSGIREIWQSETMKKYRKYHLAGEYDKIPACKNCDVWNFYPDIFFKWQKQ
jgi:radical SAM protein with 4Fe4S-binding SPASM domain